MGWCDMAMSAGRDSESLSEFEVSYEEGRKLFDAEARRHLNMSGEEFVRKWDAGEIDFDDPETHSAIVHVWILLPIIRREKLGV